jgi:hypothetical protein
MTCWSSSGREPTCRRAAAISDLIKHKSKRTQSAPMKVDADILHNAR